MRAKPYTVEILESRELLSTFTVSSLKSSGDGSLRRAILESNASPGADTINFSLPGTIRVGKASLPAITDTVTIDGTSVPSFSGTPQVTIDFHGSKGLKFDRGSDGSSLKSLALVRAGNAGVTLVASRVILEGNVIGLLANGKTLAGNRGDGVRITAPSHENLIGHVNPVTGIDYFTTKGVTIQPVSGWQGLRGADTPGQYLISGTSGSSGLLYEGPINGIGGASYLVNYPGAATTSVYGPDNLEGGRVRLVGSYRTGSDTVNGFVFEGTTAELGDASHYATIAYPGAKYNYVHSTMGGFAVGNYDQPTESGLPVGPGHAFIYNIATKTFVTDIVFPGSVSNSAYGIWWNGGTSYTIVGGFANVAVNNFLDPERPIGQGYMTDYDSASGAFTHWKAFKYPNGPASLEFDTHFEGISSVEKGVYTLAAGSAQTGTANFEQASFVSVRRNTDGTFGDSAWVDLAYPGAQGFTTNDAVFGNQIVGIAITSTGVVSYQATINTAFQLSNVISGNGGNGIAIDGANNNQVAMNYIGTDATGMLARGNRKNGIHVTRGAARNLIGGQATGGNNPTGNVFVRPPQGNLISGNQDHGVLIDHRATSTTLSGNFVGTAASGNNALGNRRDGVAIENADGNSLIGCTFQENPFVFYNVLSGNGGNGLRITNSNDTTVQANFMGVGANNATIVANGGNGLLVDGSSRNTQVGGVIPLGNVISGNDENGIEIRDTASGLTSFNTFGGIFAFGGAAPNKRNGILITSSGGNNMIRTCIISGNLGNGIELSGRATGVQIVDTATGTNTSIQTAIPNGGSGIKIAGNAHHNAIGGFKPSIEPQVTSSSNKRYGIEIVGAAHDNVIFHTSIGTNTNATVDLGNTLGGIFLGGCNSASNTVGGEGPLLQNKILYNGGNGLTIQSSRANAIAGNEIAFNLGYGLFASGDCQGTTIAQNAITSNAKGNVNLSKSRGITYAS